MCNAISATLNIETRHAQVKEEHACVPDALAIDRLIRRGKVLRGAERAQHGGPPEHRVAHHATGLVSGCGGVVGARLGIKQDGGDDGLHISAYALAVVRSPSISLLTR